MNRNLDRFPSLRTYLPVVLLLAAIAGAAPARADEAQPPETVAEAPAKQQPAAIVNGRPISAAEVDAHAEFLQLPAEYALDDLIELQLLKAAATAKGVKLPPEPWFTDTRSGVELAVARALGIELAMPRFVLIVDHAWLKDAENEKERAAGRAQLEKLRALVVDGATIPEAFTRLQLDGTLWHIGDHEDYTDDAIPPGASSLPPGSISPIIPGDGGLHLFKIHERRELPPPPEVISSLLRDELHRNATIERP